MHYVQLKTAEYFLYRIFKRRRSSLLIFFSYDWVEEGNKVLHTSPSAFNYFADHILGVMFDCLLLWVFFRNFF